MTAHVRRLESSLELRGRINLALALFSHRGYDEATARLVERALRGESIDALAAGTQARSS
jgi:hypothetical protein